MAICLIVNAQGSIESAGQYLGDPAQQCDMFALDVSEVGYLTQLEETAAFYAPISTTDFAAIASGIAAPVLIAFLVAYFVGVLVSLVK